MLWKFVSALIQDTKQNNINILYCFASQDIHLLCKVQHSVQWWIYDWIRHIGVRSWLQNWHLMKLIIWSTDPNQQQKISGEDESIWWERFIGGLVGAEVGRGGGDCLASTAAKGLLILLLLLLLVLVLLLLLLLLSSWQLASSGGPAATLSAAPRDFSEKIFGRLWTHQILLGVRNIGGGLWTTKYYWMDCDCPG